MASPRDRKDFDSWRNALQENRLKPEQLAVLQKMVEDGQAKTRERAALWPDWPGLVIDPAEHMYGF